MNFIHIWHDTESASTGVMTFENQSFTLARMVRLVQLGKVKSGGYGGMNQEERLIGRIKKMLEIMQ